MGNEDSFKPDKQEETSKTRLLNIMKIYIPYVLGALIRMIMESMNLIFINYKPNPETEVSAAVGLGNATVNLCGLSIVLGLNSALDTLISQAVGSGNTKLSALYRTRGMFVMTCAAVPIIIFLANSEKALIGLG